MNIDIRMLQPEQAGAFLLEHASGITILSVSAAPGGLLAIRYCPPVPPERPSAPEAAPEPPVAVEGRDGATERNDGQVRRLYGPDLTVDFAASLAALSPIGPSSDHFGNVLRQRMSQQIRTFISLDGERINGTASLIIEPKFSYGGLPAGHVEDVAIHPAWQGRGVGRRLMAHVMTEAWTAGCRKVTLACDRALAGFYGQHGFAENGICMRANRP